MTAGLFYECKWCSNIWNDGNNSWDRGWEWLLFIGIETINRDDGVVIDNYRFMDMTTGKTFLMDKTLAWKCKEIKGDYHECD